MRPVDKGTAPDRYTQHVLAKGDLISRIGNYCSYCERPFPEDVEHVLGKDGGRYPMLHLDWGNFLLACKSCNDTKANKQSYTLNLQADLDRYLWPHRDNTARAFDYHRSGITVARGLGALEPIAKETLTLTGFDKTPGSAAPPDSPKDLRWAAREEAWNLALRYQGKMAANPGNTPLVEAAVDLAAQTGFWSVWHAVFAQDTSMLLRLNRVFEGTDPVSFGADGRPIPRAGGQL